MKYEVPKSGNDYARREDEEGQDNVDCVFKIQKNQGKTCLCPNLFKRLLTNV